MSEVPLVVEQAGSDEGETISPQTEQVEEVEVVKHTCDPMTSQGFLNICHQFFRIDFL